MLALLRHNPRPFILVGVGVALLLGFFVIVAPLFDTSGAASAEIAGSLPTQAAAGHQLEVDVALDNTGVSIISPVCIEADLHGPLRADYAIFQGLDRETFRGGAVCGGSLNGQEDISVQIFFTPTGAGSAVVSLTPAKGPDPVGSALSGALSVSAG